MTTKNAKTILFASLIAVFAITVVMGTMPAFAASVSLTPSFSFGEDKTNGAGVNGCNNSTCRADFNSSGVNYLYTRADGSSWGVDGPNQAWVRTNHKTSPTVTHALTLTTSVTKVEYQAHIDYNGNIQYGTGSLADHQTGPELYKRHNGDWYKISSCLYTVDGSEPHSNSFIQDCNYYFSGTKDLRIGATQKNSAYSVWLSPLTIVDFESGNYYSQVEELKICDTAC